jgi:hypothetical protein
LTKVTSQSGFVCGSGAISCRSKDSEPIILSVWCFVVEGASSLSSGRSNSSLAWIGGRRSRSWIRR